MSTDEKYKAIVIGTSAGGLSALSGILDKLPSDYCVPIILVQHRIKDQRGLMEEVLQTKCRVQIKQADEKEKICDGFIYTAPPDYHLLIEKDNTFSLSSDEPVHYSRPSIDVLFESAAEVYGRYLIGIILTGGSSDGAAGISAIKRLGGLTIAQDPHEAQFPVMPEAAIHAGGVKYVWTLAEIQKFLMKISG